MGFLLLYSGKQLRGVKRCSCPNEGSMDIWNVRLPDVHLKTSHGNPPFHMASCIGLKDVALLPTVRIN